MPTIKFISVQNEDEAIATQSEDIYYKFTRSHLWLIKKCILSYEKHFLIISLIAKKEFIIDEKDTLQDVGYTTVA